MRTATYCNLCKQAGFRMYNIAQEICLAGFYFRIVRSVMEVETVSVGTVWVIFLVSNLSTNVYGSLKTLFWIEKVAQLNESWRWYCWWVIKPLIVEVKHPYVDRLNWPVLNGIFGDTCDSFLEQFHFLSAMGIFICLVPIFCEVKSYKTYWQFKYVQLD